MNKRSSILYISLIMVLAGVFMFSQYLHSNDVSWNGYMSGLMLNVWGGEKNQLIRVNLHNHAIALYQQGSLYKLSRIAATGNPRDNTATPVGSFRILSKDPWHISTQQVIMPWSLRFSNRGYYFHDIPLTLDGKRISTIYSHGCIRLFSGFAEEMYYWTHVGANVQIYDAYLARAADSPKVYLLLEDGSRKYVSYEEFIKKGYPWQDIAIVPASELDGLPLVGTPVTNTVKQ